MIIIYYIEAAAAAAAAGLSLWARCEEIFLSLPFIVSPHFIHLTMHTLHTHTIIIEWNIQCVIKYTLFFWLLFLFPHSQERSTWFLTSLFLCPLEHKLTRCIHAVRLLADEFASSSHLLVFSGGGENKVRCDMHLWSNQWKPEQRPDTIE